MDDYLESAQFSFLSGIAVDENNNIYISDTYNVVIRQVTSTNVYTLAGNSNNTLAPADGNQFTAQFAIPTAIIYIKNQTILLSDDTYIRLIKTG